MIVKRRFNPLKVWTYVQTEMLFALAVAAIAMAVSQATATPLGLPFPVTAILGSALAIFIAFRNNSAYSRWWEGRTLWSNITHSTRVLARLVITFADSHAHQPQYDASRSAEFKSTMIRLMVAWVNALRLQLREESTQTFFNTRLKMEEAEVLKRFDNLPNGIQLLMGRKIYEAMANGTLGGFDSFQMEGQLLALAQYQSAAERIKKTPLLRQYDYFTRIFLYAFLLVLPFSLVGDFSRLGIAYWMIPISLLVSFVFSVIAKVGEVNEDPFEGKITDVPLTAICTDIERNLLEMLDKTDLPASTPIEQGYLF